MKKTLLFELYMLVLASMTGYFWFFARELTGIYILLGIALVTLLALKSIVYPIASIVMIGLIEASEGVITSLPVHIYYMVGVLALLAFIIKKKHRQTSYLWIGLILITLALMVSGTHVIGSVYANTMLLVGIGIAFVYYLAYLALLPNDQYKLAILIKWIGIIITAQVGAYYFRDNNFLLLIQTKNLDLGWAKTNPVGIALLATIPMTAYCYFAQKYNKLLNGLFFVGQLGAMLLTYSRGAIIACLVILLLIFISFFFFQQQRYRIVLLMTMVVLAVGATIYFAQDHLTTIFDVTFRLGLEDSGRFQLFKDALHVFKQFPIFGEGFNLGAFGQQAMTYYHSTPLQFMAVMGSVGLVAWTIHMVGKYYVVFTHRNLLSFFGFLALLGPELYGLIDVTFFTFPYTLILILILCMIEKNHHENKVNQQDSSFFNEEES